MGLSDPGQFKIAWLGPLSISFSATNPKNKWFKLDFEKAFDKVEHKLMLQVMKHKGFGPKWMNWMELIFNSGTSSGFLVKSFIAREGSDRETHSPPFCLSLVLIYFSR